MHRYGDFVRKSEIYIEKDDDNNQRYLLRIPLRNLEGNKVLVILKNPSIANEVESDLTINRIVKFCYNNGYSEVNIMNLYAYYSTESRGIRELILAGKKDIAIGERNDDVLKENIDRVDEIIVAWGTDSFGCTTHYKNRIRDVVKMIKDKPIYYVQSCAEKGWYPRHAQVWNINQGIEKYIWNYQDTIKSR